MIYGQIEYLLINWLGHLLSLTRSIQTPKRGQVVSLFFHRLIKRCSVDGAFPNMSQIISIYLQKRAYKQSNHWHCQCWNLIKLWVSDPLPVSKLTATHCVKSVCIRNFSGPNVGKYGPEKLRIRTLFSQWVK